MRLSAAINDKNETAYSIGNVEKRKFPNRVGSSLQSKALKSGGESSNTIIYTTEDKSQEVKTAIQLAFEKALKKQANDITISNDPNARRSKDDTIYLSAAERGDMKTVQKRRINGFAWS